MIYKLDSKGKVRTLIISVDGDDLVQDSGLKDGKRVVHRKTCKGKNIGKTNETTPSQQATKEAAAKIKKKLSKEYFLTEQDARSNVVILPMLAKDYKEESHKIDWKRPVYIQPKLDGMRCLSFLENESVDLISRENNTITTMEHIENALLFMGKGIILDGELYAHGLSFQDNMTLVKSVGPRTPDMKYHVYDMISDSSFEERYKELVTIVEEIDDENILLVETIRIKSEAELKAFHTAYLAAGYEGTIVRHGEEPYKLNVRSSNLLKYKDFIDTACKVLDIVPEDARPTHGRVICLFNNQQIRCTLHLSFAEKEEVLINKKDYIGRTAEIRYFELTNKGMPRFPGCVGFREDK